MPITIRQLAKLAGVSPATVSRSLNDSPLIPAETRNRIRNLAAEQGFAFNAIARSLSLGKTGTVGLIFPDYFESFSIGLFFTQLQRLVRMNLEKENLDVLVAFPFNRFEGSSNVEKLVMTRKIDSMILIDNAFAPTDRSILEAADIPYLFLHKRPNDGAAPGADFYCTDHFEGGILAAKRLADLGRKRLLVARAVGEEFDARTAGFLEGAKRAGIAEKEIDILYGDLTFEQGYADVGGRLISAVSGKPYDGVFCQTDLMALGAISALRGAGIRVPEDVSVVGYDDIELGREFRPALTTIHQPLAEISALACERLIERMSHKTTRDDLAEQTEPAHILLKPTLVVRES